MKYKDAESLKKNRDFQLDIKQEHLMEIGI